LILRSETILDFTDIESVRDVLPTLEKRRALRVIHRRLLPRRPGRDTGLEQFCTFYSGREDKNAATDTLILTPIVKQREELPYYHPQVHHLAFRYISSHARNTIRIEALPLPDTPISITSRLYRTSLSLLETVHRYGWGALNNYQKRVAHDNILPRETYQDLYLVMRERHKHLVGTWQEKTDPRKHVFEVSRRELVRPKSRQLLCGRSS
jgi:tRNASer (uridine44-2'-O)-methyltransferase